MQTGAAIAILVRVKPKVRPALVDGIFYPGEKAKLRGSVEELLSRCPTPEGDGFAAVAPHAGFSYAGPIIASAFRSVARRRPSAVVLLGPVHRDPADGIFLPESGYFATPLGQARVSARWVEALLSLGAPFRRDDAPHLEENCIEVLLPFLQVQFPEADIVPLLTGRPTPRTVRALADGLDLTFRTSYDYILFVVSSNMSSYLTGRNTEAESAALRDLVCAADGRGILSALERGRISSCGAAGIAAVLTLGGARLRAEPLAEGDSRGTDGDGQHAVHYASFCFHRRPEPAGTGS